MSMAIARRIPLDHPCDTCDICGDWIELHDWKPVCKSGCKQPTEPEEDEQELKLPQLDSYEDGPIDGYDY